MSRDHYLVPEVRRRLGFMTDKPVYAAIRGGLIRAVKVGRVFLINRDDVDAIARGEQPTQVSQ